MFNLEILVVELLAIDGLAASTIVICKITALKHKGFDHAMKSGALVVERFAGFAHALFSGAESTEIFCSLGYNIIVELENDTS